MHAPACRYASAESPIARWQWLFQQQSSLRAFAWFPLFAAFALAACSPARGEEAPLDFQTQIWPLLNANCIACHKSSEAESGVNLESPQTMRDSDLDGVIVPGKPEESRLYQVAAGVDEPVMPPEDNDVGARRLTDAELQLLERWILEGAHGEAASVTGELPNLQPLPPELRSTFAVALSDDARIAAVGIGNRLRVMWLPSGEIVARPGRLDAAGDPSEAHVDFVYSLAMTADGQTLVSGGFRNFKVWRFRPFHTAAQLVAPMPITGAATAWREGALLSVGEQGQITRVAADGSAQVLFQLDPPHDSVRIASDVEAGVAVIATANQVVLVDQSQTVALEYPASAITAVAIAAPDRVVAGTEAGELISWNRDGDQWQIAAAIPCGGSPLELLERVAPAPSSAAASDATTEGSQRLLAIDAAGQIYAVPAEGPPQPLIQLPQPPLRVSVSDSAQGMAVVEDGSLIPFRVVTAEEGAAGSLQLGEAIRQTPWARREADRARWQQRLAEGEFAAAKQQAEAASEAVRKEEAHRKEVDQRAEAAKAELQEAEKAASEQEAEPDAEQADKQQAAIVAARSKAESAAADAMRAAELLQRAQQQLTEAETRRDQLEHQSQAAVAAADAAEQQAASSHFRDTKTFWFGSVAVTWTASQAGAPARWDAWHCGAPQLGSQWLGPLDWPADHRPLAAGTGTLWTAGPDATVARRELSAEPWELDYQRGEPRQGGPLADRVLALDISSDGRYLAVGGGVPSQAGQLQVWDLASGELIAEPESSHADSVMAVRFSHDGATLATGGADRMIHLWRVDEGHLERTATLEGHTHHVTSLAWQPDGRQLASGSADASVKLWDPATRGQNRSIDGLAKELTAIVLLGTGDTVAAVGGDGRVRIRRTSDGGSVAEFAAAAGYIDALAADRAGQHLLTGDTEGRVRLFDATGKELGQFAPE